MGISISKPYFTYTSNSFESNVYALYDTPHLLKSIRNNLYNNGLVINKY